jgi:hypothetical protein
MIKCDGDGAARVFDVAPACYGGGSHGITAGGGVGMAYLEEWKRRWAGRLFAGGLGPFAAWLCISGFWHDYWNGV